MFFRKKIRSDIISWWLTLFTALVLNYFSTAKKTGSNYLGVSRFEYILRTSLSLSICLFLYFSFLFTNILLYFLMVVVEFAWESCRIDFMSILNLVKTYINVCYLEIINFSSKFWFDGSSNFLVELNMFSTIFYIN